MASILNDTMNAAKSAMESAREGAEHAMGSAKEGTEHAVASTRSAFFEGVRTVNGLISTLKSLDGDDALGWVGLARKRSSFYSVAIFGAGIAVGAGVGMLLAPMSGAKLREMIFGKIREAGTEAKTAVQEAEHKVEDLASKAGTAVKDAEKQVEDKVAKGAEAVKDKVTAGAEVVKDKVMHQVGALADMAEDMIDDVRPNQTASNNSSNGHGASKTKGNHVSSGNQTRHS